MFIEKCKIIWSIDLHCMYKFCCHWSNILYCTVVSDYTIVECILYKCLLTIMTQFRKCTINILLNYIYLYVIDVRIVFSIYY